MAIKRWSGLLAELYATKRWDQVLVFTRTKHRANGEAADLRVVGITKVTRSATDEKVLDFLEQKKLSFPMAKHNGAADQALSPEETVP